MIRIRYKALALCVLAGLALGLGGCASEEVRPGEDSLIAAEAMGILKKLEAAYAAHDTAAMQGLMTDAVFTRVRAELRSFESVDITLSPTWLDIPSDAERVLNVSWKGVWTQDSGVVESQQGDAVFTLQGKPLRISSIRGTSPFSYPRGAAPYGR